ncbi:MAG: hypothetical protein OCD76_12955 [Reichenbachiella sp.]
MEESTKLYSQKAIGIATYFGGPLAAGILIRRNYINLKKEKLGLNTLIVSVIATCLLFGGLFSIPEHIIDKIPNSVIPLIYTGIIYLIVERIQGKELKELKESNGVFYSKWRAFSVGLVSGIVIVGGIFGFLFLEEGSWDSDTYNSKMDLHTSNEIEAMKLFDILDTGSKSELKRFINDKGIPKWKENLVLLNSLNDIEDIPDEYLKQVRLLTEYTSLRIETYELILKAVISDSSEYDEEVIQRHTRIEEIIAEL